MAEIAVCSARPRPSVHTNNSKGHQWWSRDVYHLLAGVGRTRCGIDCSEWLTVGPMDELTDVCCVRCKRKAAA